MKMKQTLYPCVQGWTEVFYDGELKVVDNIVEIPEGKEHWTMILAVERGFVELDESQEDEAALVAASTPARTPKKSKEPANGR